MKSGINYLVCALFLLSVIACKKDDDDVNPGGIAGTWRLTDLHADDGVARYYDEFFEDTVQYTYRFHAEDLNTMTTFTENPNEFVSTGSYTYVLTTNIFGFESTTEQPVDVGNTSGTWTLNGNTMTQTVLGNTNSFEVLELTNNVLRLKANIDVVVVDQGVEVRNTQTAFSTFERQ